MADRVMEADYWKSQGRKFCDFCKCWIADNKPSIEFHEGGKKHKENVSKRLREIHKNSAKQARQHRKFEDDIKKMETAAMAAYLKDVENNTTDLTAERIIKEKLTNGDKKKIDTLAASVPKPSQLATPEASPRYNNRKFHPTVGESQNRGGKGSRGEKEHTFGIDPCDPSSSSRPKPSAVGEAKSIAKAKTKGKKGPRRTGDEKSKTLQQKLWYEAVSDEGYTYYWHIETNESVWETPPEGFASIAEQEEEAKEQALQEELLAQIAEDEEKKMEETADERRANAEREKHREIRRKREEKEAADDNSDDDINRGVQFRRDYSVPEKPEPYGTWKTVQVIERKSVDLELPNKREIMSIAVPTLEREAPPPRIFKEKTVTKISIGDSDDETAAPSTFKKRKFGIKNVRKRLDDD